METLNFLKSKPSKVLIGFVIVLGVIIIAKTGYSIGQWLHQLVN